MFRMHKRLFIRESFEIDEGQRTRPHRPFNLAAGFDYEDNHQVDQSLDPCERPHKKGSTNRENLIKGGSVMDEWAFAVLTLLESDSPIALSMR